MKRGCPGAAERAKDQNSVTETSAIPLAPLIRPAEGGADSQAHGMCPADGPGLAGVDGMADLVPGTERNASLGFRGYGGLHGNVGVSSHIGCRS